MPTCENVSLPRSVLHLAANSSVMFGTVWMSAYRALPARSAAIVLTHGTPRVDDRTFVTSLVLCARPSWNHVLRERPFVTLASRTAKAVVGVQASGRLRPPPTTGP